MKKIINNPTTVVNEMVEGMVLAHPELRFIEETQVVIRRGAPFKGKVGLISGGGSGHEPAHAGYVGKGMLDAACLGDVFTSPSVDQIIKGIKAVDSGKGVLIIAKNYTGDNLNFDLAQELLIEEGLEVAKVVVNDDVAVENSEHTTGRRGVAGTVFVHKIAGAKALTGASLEEVEKTALKVIANVRTFGIGLTPCIIPSVGVPSFLLGENEIELGIGIHGEKGIIRTSLKNASELAKEMLTPILKDLPFKTGNQVAVMLNGMGATPLMELYILFSEIGKRLKAKGIDIYRSYVGEYMTSLEMGGCSLTLLNLDEELKELLDASADTPGFIQNELR